MNFISAAFHEALLHPISERAQVIAFPSAKIWALSCRLGSKWLLESSVCCSLISYRKKCMLKINASEVVFFSISGAFALITIKKSFAESSSRSIPVACLSLCLCRWDFVLSLTLFLQEEWLCPIFCFPCCFNWHDSSALMGSSPFLASVSVHKSKWLLVKSMDNVGVTPVFMLSSVIMLWWSVWRFQCENHIVKKKFVAVMEH